MTRKIVEYASKSMVYCGAVGGVIGGLNLARHNIEYCMIHDKKIYEKHSVVVRTFMVTSYCAIGFVGGGFMGFACGMIWPITLSAMCYKCYIDNDTKKIEEV